GGVGREVFLDLLRDAEELVGVGSGDLDVDGVDGAADLGAEGDLLGSDDGADAAAPVGGHVRGVHRDAALLGAVGLDGDAAEVGAGVVGDAAPAGDGRAGGGDDMLDDAPSVGT